jgi:integrin beta 1
MISVRLIQLYNMKRSRCMTQKDLKDAKCREQYIETNQYEEARITKDDELRDFNKDFDSVQIKPQNVKMKLRKSRQQRITMNYKPARNYPLDLYYLMDLSWTMRDDKKTLVGMGGSLSKSLSNLTENFRLGFGSFADKPIMPFINPGSEKNPCDLVQDNCLPTYGFKHKLGLTDDIQQFVAKVNSSEITANLDNLEGKQLFVLLDNQFKSTCMLFHAHLVNLLSSN